MKYRTGLASLVALACMSGATLAQDLEIGSMAPELSISKWLKGEPFDLESAKGEQITIVEFWASW